MSLHIYIYIFPYTSPAFSPIYLFALDYPGFNTDSPVSLANYDYWLP